MDTVFKNAKDHNYLHHAYLLVGDREALTHQILVGLEQYFGIPSANNPDISIKNYGHMGVDDARGLSGAQTHTSFSSSEESSRKIFIISADSLTIPAQNALLKTLEEPTAGTHMFIILPRTEAILPTLRSRVVALDMRTHDHSRNDLVDKFLSGSLAERFAISKKLAESKKDDAIDREAIRAFLDGVERAISVSPERKSVAVVDALCEAKQFLALQGSSPKMLLDYLAIVLG